MEMDLKPGYKTTEFWLTLVGMAATALAAIPAPQAALGAAVLSGVYTVGRSFVKAKAAAPGTAAKPAESIQGATRPRL